MNHERIPHQEETDECPKDMVVVVKVDACDQVDDDVASRKERVEYSEKEKFYHSDGCPTKDSNVLRKRGLLSLTFLQKSTYEVLMSWL